MPVSTRRVVLMPVPGLALVHGSMLRTQHASATMTQPLRLRARMTVVWTVGSPSLAFGNRDARPGGTSRLVPNG